MNRTSIGFLSLMIYIFFIDVFTALRVGISEVYCIAGLFEPIYAYALYVINQIVWEYHLDCTKKTPAPCGAGAIQSL